jgi:hypothetical protein
VTDTSAPVARVGSGNAFSVTGAANPEIAFQLKSQVQEHILDYLNQFKKGSLIGAVADPKPAMKLLETPTPALLLGAYRNGKLLYFGHSGTGFSEKGLAEAIFACFGCTIWPAWIVAATVIAASTVNKVLILFVFVLGRNGFDVTAP